jgi:hypothetical protein
LFQEWALTHDPEILLKTDISRLWSGYPNPRDSLGKGPRFETIVSDLNDAGFPTLWAARISLAGLSRRTGLSKSSVAAAVRQALRIGVLKRAHEHSPRGKPMPSL